MTGLNRSPMSTGIWANNFGTSAVQIAQRFISNGIECNLWEVGNKWLPGSATVHLWPDLDLQAEMFNET